ncbi:hypothetical protein MUNTM_57790 [Mycobacterium sp. MUNTM1]
MTVIGTELAATRRPDEAQRDASTDGLARPAGDSGDAGDTDPHVEALAGMSTKSEAIGYAVSVLHGAPPAQVMTWLARYGYTVSRSKVSPAVKKYRDAHGLSDEPQVQGVALPRSSQHFVPGTPPTAGDSPVTPCSMSRSETPDTADSSQVREDADRGASPDLRDDVPTVPVIAGGRCVPDHDFTPQREQRAPWVAFACYAVALVSLGVSLNTSWRFFAQVLHIPIAYGERYVMFAVAELALVVCGAGMAVNVHREGRPGAFRTIVWAMCVAMAYMAWAESTTEEAIGRILLGPVLGTVMLHLGLGLELRSRHRGTGTTARIGRELRERCLSWMGLSDDARDAAQRIRDRKAYKAAALSLPQRRPWSRQARLERALLAAGVADDPRMRERLVARLAVVRHAGALSTFTPPSPWG